MELFSGDLPVVQLSSDLVRPLNRSFEGESVSVQLNRSMMDGIEQLGKKQGASLYVTLLSAVSCLLHKYTGLTDLIIGSPVSGRNETLLKDCRI